jgi:hypothetical protein
MPFPKAKTSHGINSSRNIFHLQGQVQMPRPCPLASTARGLILLLTDAYKFAEKVIEVETALDDEEFLG